VRLRCNGLAAAPRNDHHRAAGKTIAARRVHDSVDSMTIARAIEQTAQRKVLGAFDALTARQMRYER